ncbi:hypothetical protein HDR61_01345 [bacterium]|nr:hypothetical protein [bacterium]
MTRDEFLSSVRSRGAFTANSATPRDIATTNALLQGMRAAMLPPALIELYNATTAISRGSAYIFGPTEVPRPNHHPIPSIIDINRDMAHIQSLRGKTIFARNDLFLFTFDAFGVFFMMDPLNLRCLRKYDDAYRAMTDCLAVGKI